MADPKQIAALLVAKHGAPESPSQEQTESGDSMLEGAAQEVMDALKADDVEAFTEALQSFIQIAMP